MNHKNYQVHEEDELHINSIQKTKLNKNNISPEKHSSETEYYFLSLIVTSEKLVKMLDLKTIASYYFF